MAGWLCRHPGRTKGEQLGRSGVDHVGVQWWGDGSRSEGADAGAAERVRYAVRRSCAAFWRVVAMYTGCHSGLEAAFRSVSMVDKRESPHTVALCVPHGS